MTIAYLSITDIAERLGVSVNSVKGYAFKGMLPAPDATVGTARGWLPATIDRWHAGRPGHGGRPLSNA